MGTKQWSAFITKYGDNIYRKYQALKSVGINEYPARLQAWLSEREQPGRFYAFGISEPNLDKWAKHVLKIYTTSKIYGSAKDSMDYNSYVKAMRPYNKSDNYLNDWLPKGLNEYLRYIEYRINNKIQ